MFDTKIVIVVRDDLQTWQKLNITAFMMSGVVGATPNLIGETYRDAAGHTYHPLSIQPVIVLAADGERLGTIHKRALDNDVRHALYIEEMFATGHDTANRAVFAAFTPDAAKVVGIGFRAERKLADKIAKGAKMHP